MCKSVLNAYKNREFSFHSHLWKICGKLLHPADNSFYPLFSTAIHRDV